jgi:hypothetical protein
MNRGRRGEKIFHGADDYQAFIDLLKESSRMWQVCGRKTGEDRQRV